MNKTFFALYLFSFEISYVYFFCLLYVPKGTRRSRCIPSILDAHIRSNCRDRPSSKKDLTGGKFLYRPVLSPQGTDIGTIRQVLSDFISARHSRHATSAPIKDWFSAIPKGRQANAPFGQILNALAIGSLIAPIYYISNPLITTSYISLVTNNEFLYVPNFLYLA